MPKPNFSGRWRFNPDKSVPEISPPDSTLHVMDHHESRLTRNLMPVHGSPELVRRLTDGFIAAGKMLDIGKACIHFHKAEDLALDVIGSIISGVPLARYVEMAKAARWR